MHILVTGGAGILGAEITHQLLEAGHQITVADTATDPLRLASIRDRIAVERVDVGDQAAITALIARVRPQHLYHCAAVLGPEAEQDEVASFRANVAGTQYVLEASRRHGVERVCFVSTTGSNGAMSGVVTDDHLQRPGIVYGIEKLYGEQLCAWFRRRHTLDVRTIRYAQIAGPNCTICWVWAPAMIEDAIAGRVHHARFATPHSAMSMLHIHDAGRAAIELLAAPSEQLKRCTYQVVDGPRVTTAQDLAEALARRFPGFSVQWSGPGQPGTLIGYDDSPARSDWGWTARVVGLDALIDAFVADLSVRPQRFGVTL